MRNLHRWAVAIVMLGAASAWAQSDAQKALDRFKSMEGTWVGKDAHGESAEVTYRVIAGGTSVMADIKMGDEAMTSLFYVDGGRLLMTHFCPSGNQPRMQAVIGPDGKTVTFDFLDATNLPSPQTGHMHRVVYGFADADHYSEDWTWKHEGKDSHFQLEMGRKK
ncbi:MAG TPA: hypothetical protein VK473_10825 [Terriglobales bacterium]|nr:hypothetical protein [Terriglobales bacterium]